jgi:CheY-like chemotaxis protein
MAAKRVLIVEDQRRSQESLRLCLEIAGFDANTVSSGPAGLALALEWLPEFLLCDIGLPGGLDGWELATQLRQNPLGRSISASLPSVPMGATRIWPAHVR